MICSRLYCDRGISNAAFIRLDVIDVGSWDAVIDDAVARLTIFLAQIKTPILNDITPDG